MRKPVPFARFYHIGENWSGYNAAVEFCRKKGLSVGSREFAAPTALYDDGSVYVSKWHNLQKEDHETMWGFIECPDKRNGDATVCQFIEKEEKDDNKA